MSSNDSLLGPEIGRELLSRSREKGCITYDEINALLPEEVSVEEIDELFALCDNLDINIVDAPQLEEVKEKIEKRKIREQVVFSDEETETKSPIRMYLKEMGEISLLSREEEIEMAMNIEKEKIGILSCLVDILPFKDVISHLQEQLSKSDMKLKDVFDCVEDGDFPEIEESCQEKILNLL